MDKEPTYNSPEALAQFFKIMNAQVATQIETIKDDDDALKEHLLRKLMAEAKRQEGELAAARKRAGK